MISATAISVLPDSSPLLRDLVVIAGANSASSRGIFVNPGNGTTSGSPRIESCDVRLGSSANGWAVDQGSFGIRVNGGAAEIVDNLVTLANSHTIQHAIEIGSGAPGTLVERNVVRGGTGTSGAMGIHIGGGAALVQNNDVALGQCAAFGNGIEVGGALSGVRLFHNVAFGGDGSPTSYGLAVSFEGVPTVPPDLLVHSNFFAGGLGGTLTAGINLGENPTRAMTAGRFYDNLVHSGTGAMRFAVREQSANIDPVLFSANALHVDMAASGTAGTALYLDEAATAINSPTTINALAATTGNLDDDCGIAPIVGGDFHLPTGMACFDAGDAREAPPIDFEGDDRVIGAAPDIGLDERVSP